MTPYVMRNINFEFDSAVLGESSFAEIDSLVDFMNANPKIYLEVAGYTDNSGSEEHNNTLSMNRAAAVVNALIERGINKNRLVAVGYGALRPIAPNDNESNKALNRRVEIRVIY